MGEVTATQVRRDAVRRLIELAGPDAYDPDLMASRPASLEILRRRVLDRRDPAATAELEQLWPIAAGDTAALIDATAAQEHA